ncbi:AMIN domain-containing protein [Desulfovibrio sp. JC010]|uniref:AMIN domain-containing protein n=1 Tax=Desulfovibrio sp. JC010 TaxID=2593641 RepID=UPI0013D10671|nr:AMIN domain-containing protein [Desulfovibrio sp. JC010]NDV28415.1 AMIN domain-containing protein [Desulfovibrio sp. JC010]
MKMKFRPFTALLLTLLLLVGVCAAAFHMGFFDAFFAEKVEIVQQQEGEGPVVRREVSKLVLPLESGQPGEAEGLNEQDLAAGNNSASTPSSEEHEQNGPDAGNKTEQVVAEKKISESKPESKPKPKPEPKPKAKSVKPLSVKGVLRGIDVSCQPKQAALEISLSSAAGRISWFNLDKPRRLVVDLHGKWKNKAKSVYRIKDCPVQKIVLGEHPGKIRLVIYLDEKAAPAKIKPAVRREDKGIFLKLDF